MTEIPRPSAIAGMACNEPDDESQFDGVRALAELLCRIEAERPEWQKHALCLDHPDVSFFVEVGESTEPAKDICARCSVRADCLAYALSDPRNHHGVWAGVGRNELEQLRQEANAA